MSGNHRRASDSTCSLKDLSRNGYRRVDGVADDADPGCGAVLGHAFAQALHDACAAQLDDSQQSIPASVTDPKEPTMALPMRQLSRSLLVHTPKLKRKRPWMLTTRGHTRGAGHAGTPSAPALMLNRSSRVMPGFRGTPAGMSTRWHPYSAPDNCSGPTKLVTYVAPAHQP